MIGRFIKANLLKPMKNFPSGFRTVLGGILCASWIGVFGAAPWAKPGQTSAGEISRWGLEVSSPGGMIVPPSPESPDFAGGDANPSSPGSGAGGPRVGDVLVPPHPLDLPVDVPAPQMPVITAVALDRANRLFATGGDDHRIRLWELPDGRLKQRIEPHRGWVRAVTFSPDGLRLATGGDDRYVMLFRVGEAEPVWKVELGAAVYALVFSPDGRRLAAAGFSDKIWLLDSESGRQMAVWTAAGQDVRALAFSPEGGQLAAGARNGIIRLWDSLEGIRQRDVAAHQRRVRALAYSPDGAMLVSAGEDGRIVLCNPKTDAPPRVLSQMPGAVYAVAFCGVDRLAVGGTDNRIRVVSVTDGRVLRELTGHTGTVAALGWESGTQTLISGGFDTTVRFWQLDARAGMPLAQRSRDQSGLSSENSLPEQDTLPGSQPIPGRLPTHGDQPRPTVPSPENSGPNLGEIFPPEVP